MKKTKNCPYYKNRHSCFLLQYHLVLITKYRHPVLTEGVEDYLQQYTLQYFNEHKLNILEINTNKDHIHILFETPPQINLANFINVYKTASSRKLQNTFNEKLSSYYWKSYFWSDSYFICSVSEANTKVVQNYIQNQK